MTWRRSSIGPSSPSASTWHTPRVTGRVADHGVAQPERRPARSSASSPARWSASRVERGLAVEVVGVGDAERVGRLAGRRRPHSTACDGAVRALLDGEADVDRARPRPLDVVADGRTGRRPDDQDDRAEAGGEASLASRSMTASPPARRGPGACSRRSGGPGRRPARPGPVTGVVGSGSRSPQRRTALAQVMPPPKPVSSRWSPSATRPSRGRRRGRAGWRPTTCCRSGR